MLFGKSPNPWARVLWISVCVAVLLMVPATWWILASLRIVRWPSSSSRWELYCGFGAGAIVVFECLLFVRKRWLRGWRRLLWVIPLSTAKRWLFWHVWLGLIAIPLAIVHSGFGWGGALSAWTLGLFLLVSASGIWGLVLQQLLPRYLLDVIPEETIEAKIDLVALAQAAEAERLVLALTADAPLPQATEPFQDLGLPAVRLRPGAAVAKRLVDFFREEVKPYLVSGRSQLASRERCQSMFDQLRRELPEEALVHTRALERYCDVRRAMDRQRRIHWWLHSWLAVHAPLSAALFVLLAWHALAAMKLWRAY